MADARIFRITYASGKVRYGNRITASGAASFSVFARAGRRTDKVLRVEAANAEATSGWADVSHEFLTAAGMNARRR